MKFTIKGDFYFGQFVEENIDTTDGMIEKNCPANLDEELWKCPTYLKHIEKVVESAVSGQKTWQKLKFEERISYLKNYKENLIARKDEIAMAIALETGKPLWESMQEATSCIGKVDLTINESLEKISPKIYENILPQTVGRVGYRPIGPCLVIGPFNFPCHLPNGQILPALLAGNSVIFKPSEKCAYSAQLLIECFQAAEFPSGVINLIHGTGETASRLLKEKELKGIYFTGSKDVGKKIIKITHTDLTKLVALEMGGKNTSIVHKDADLEHTLAETLKACYLTSGQRCVSTSIIAIHNSLKDEFIDRFHACAKKLIIDHPTDHEKEPFMGPLVDERSAENYLLFMGMAKREGLTEIMRGKNLTKKFRGHYVSPSIHFAERIHNDSLFLNSEIFGPNVTFIPYDNVDEAINIANNSKYGLSAALFSKDKELQEKCLNELNVGVLNFNRSTVGASGKLPFGGVKESGNYRPAGISMVESCVAPMASLSIEEGDSKLSDLKGLEL